MIFSVLSFAQESGKKKTSEYKSPGFAPDSIFVIVREDTRFLKHKVKKGETVYSIIRFYNTEFDLLKKNNPGLDKDGLKENQNLIIPINPKAIISIQDKSFKESEYYKLYYKVRPKETAYSIAKKYFSISVAELQKRNNLKSGLKSGQILHVAWLHKSGIPDSLNNLPWISGVLALENKKNRKKYESALLDGSKEIYFEGKSCWPKDKPMDSGKSLHILHSKAKKGTIVRIENPMTERIVYAKVIGPMPDTSFAKDSELMLSTTVAKLLGVLDSYSFLKIKYLLNK